MENHGIGKSTLILQICDKIKGEGKVLYVSGEESAEQIKIRADRLGINKDNIMFLGETDINNIENAIEKMEPKLVIIDSIQTMYSDEITAAAGSVSQVREITGRIMKLCKSNNITTIIIPLSNTHALVFLIHTMTLYITKAIITISIISVHVIRGIYNLTR